jgi:diaminohydroxyphosphoribosylaminopyrimidine deaminase/5-amino-6-(5-phosphoribosylamino)uracil reductase
MTEVTADEKFMKQCFSLALKAEGRTAPNPIVGAIVVQNDGTVVGSGYHPEHGRPHAEVFALDEAGDRARGSTIYVSLEPCCHHGRTPPCTDKVIASGVKRVVAAMTDPNPKVGGNGFEKLRAAGIEVVTGVLESEAQWLNRAFVKTIKTGMPWVVLKIAATLDGRIADRKNKSKWITGPEARRYVHELRNRLDCVLVGSNTARIDDPELNVRDLPEFRHPKRAVIDTTLSLAPTARLFDCGTGGDTIVYCSEMANSKPGYPTNVHLVSIRNSSSPGSSRLDLQALLEDLRKRGVSSVLCEGGGRLAGSLVDQDLVDEIIWIVSPSILGDVESVAGVCMEKEIALPDMKRYRMLESIRLGDDIAIHLTRQ